MPADPAQVVRRPPEEPTREAPTSPTEMPKPTSPPSATSPAEELGAPHYPAGELTDCGLVTFGIAVGDVIEDVSDGPDWDNEGADDTSIAELPSTPCMEESEIMVPTEIPTSPHTATPTLTAESRAQHELNF